MEMVLDILKIVYLGLGVIFGLIAVHKVTSDNDERFPTVWHLIFLFCFSVLFWIVGLIIYLKENSGGRN